MTFINQARSRIFPFLFTTTVKEIAMAPGGFQHQ
jgi:hypothetical protein